MKYFIGIRFSIFTNGVKAYSDPAYRERLLDSQRLKYRLRIFKGIVLPCLNQLRIPEGDEAEVLLFYSDEIGSLLINELQYCSEECALDTTLVPVSATEKFSNLFSDQVHGSLRDEPANAVYATVRMDDDDALSPDYLMHLKKYMRPEFDNFVVSFPLGYIGLWSPKKNQWEKLAFYYFPKIALGLARIGVWRSLGSESSRVRNIYQCGNHMRIDQRYPLIMDASFIAYARSIHEQNDSISSEDYVRGFPAASIGESFLGGCDDRSATEIRLKDCDDSLVKLKKARKQLSVIAAHESEA